MPVIGHKKVQLIAFVFSLNHFFLPDSPSFQPNPLIQDILAKCSSKLLHQNIWNKYLLYIKGEM